jgi:hypothetical protein
VVFDLCLLFPFSVLNAQNTGQLDVSLEGVTSVVSRSLGRILTGISTLSSADFLRTTPNNFNSSSLVSKDNKFSAWISVQFQFLNLYTAGRTLWTGDQLVTRPLSTHQNNTNTE